MTFWTKFNFKLNFKFQIQLKGWVSIFLKFKTWLLILNFAKKKKHNYCKSNYSNLLLCKNKLFLQTVSPAQSSQVLAVFIGRQDLSVESYHSLQHNSSMVIWGCFGSFTNSDFMFMRSINFWNPNCISKHNFSFKPTSTQINDLKTWFQFHENT